MISSQDLDMLYTSGTGLVYPDPTYYKEGSGDKLLCTTKS